MNWIFAGLLMSLPIVLGELLAGKFKTKEHARKFVHVSAGLCAALLPLLLDFKQIAILALIFTPPMIIARKKSLMASMSGMKRKTYGDVLFAPGIAAIAFWVQTIEVYLFGILVMALADSLAGMIGSKYGNKKFKIYASEKSFAGSFAFFAVTMVIGTLIIASSSLGFGQLGTLFLISTLLTLEEAALPYGLDNLFIPPSAGVLFGLFII